MSAGSIMMQENINTANEISPDTNDIGLEDMTSLCFTNIFLTPHYTKEEEVEVVKFEKKYNVKVERLTDNDAIFLNDEKIIKV